MGLADDANSVGGGANKDEASVSKNHKKKEDDLLELKQKLELYVERLQDPNPELQRLALESMRQEIQASMTSVMFLSPHYETLVAFHGKMADSHLKKYLSDILSVLAFTTSPEPEVESLRYRLIGTEGDIGSWGREYVMNLADGIVEEYRKRQREEAPTNDLKDLVLQIFAFLMKHNEETEALGLLIAVRLLMDVDGLDVLLEHVDKANFERTCNYFTRAAATILSEPDAKLVLDISYMIYMKFEDYLNALEMALFLDNTQYVKKVFTSCADPLTKKQFCHMIASHGKTFDLDDEMVTDDNDREVQDIVNNTKLSEGYPTLAKYIKAKSAYLARIEAKYSSADVEYDSDIEYLSDVEEYSDIKTFFWRYPATHLYWNLEHYPIPDNADLDPIYVNIKLALHKMGIHGWLDIYAYGDRPINAKSDLYEARFSFMPLQGARKMSTDILVKATAGAAQCSPEKPAFVLLSKDNPELLRVLEGLQSRDHYILKIEPLTAQLQDLFQSRDSVHACTQFLGGERTRRKTWSRKDAFKRNTGPKAGVFWDEVDCPFPAGLKDPDEICTKITSALCERGAMGKMSISVYVDEKKECWGELLRNKTTKSGIHFCPGGDKPERRERMLHDILFWEIDNEADLPCPSDLIVVADNDKDLFKMLETIEKNGYSVFLVTPTNSTGPEKIEWPGDLLDNVYDFGSITESSKPKRQNVGEGS